jgi:hypothetical protein
MNSFFKSFSSLTLFTIFFLMPFLANAQFNYSVSHKDTVHYSDNSVNVITKQNLKNKEYKSGNLAEMPQFNPKSNAAIKIYYPPQNLVYNMPIVGKKDTSQVNFHVKKCQKDSIGIKNQSQN